MIFAFLTAVLNVYAIFDFNGFPCGQLFDVYRTATLSVIKECKYFNIFLHILISMQRFNLGICNMS